MLGLTHKVNGLTNKLKKSFVIFKNLIKVSRCKSDRIGLVYLDLDRNPHGRYLFCLVKMLDLSGWQVVFPKKRIALFRDLLSDKYAAYILEDDLACFGQPVLPKNLQIRFVASGKLDVDYFGFLRKTKGEGEQYRLVPMPQHPTMYRIGAFDKELTQVKRCNSVFFAGNLEREEYTKLEDIALFPILSRIEILEVLKTTVAYPHDLAELKQWIRKREQENACVIVDSRKFKIPFSELRSTLNSFDYFLALPGVYMPFSHNIVEALSVGSIPIIQRGYADLFDPPLRNEVHCLTFEGKEQLNATLATAFSLSEDERDALSKSAKTYYERHMTPAAVTRQVIELNRNEALFLLGSGGASVREYYAREDGAGAK